MNRAISGYVTVSGSGQPLPGMQVVAARLHGEQAEVLGAAVSGDLGRFRVLYAPVDGPADLTVLIFSSEGRLLFTEPLHRQISGAELCIRVEVPRSALSEQMH